MQSNNVTILITISRSDKTIAGVVISDVYGKYRYEYDFCGILAVYTFFGSQSPHITFP